jgi:hypothetical protein
MELDILPVYGDGDQWLLAAAMEDSTMEGFSVKCKEERKI